MDSENILANLVRIGVVSAVDIGTRKARVIFKDKGFTSGWLHVLQHHGAGVCVKENGDHTHDITGGGTASTAGLHDHIANVTYWMPVLNETVVVLYLPVFNADGFILGGI